MKAIIIAAGMGTRLGPLTADLPKSMAIQLEGKTLLETQLETLRSAGISDISIVRGYKAEKMTYPGVKYYLNDRYSHNNILASIFYAEQELSDDVLIIYSDLWFERGVLEQMMMPSQDLAIAINPNWQKFHANKKNHTLDHSVFVVRNNLNLVKKIGRIAKEEKQLDCEFDGIIKLSKKGCELFKRHYHEAKTKSGGGAFQRVSVFEKASLTDLLQEMADQGIPIYCEEIKGHLLEIDTPEDLEEARRFIRLQNVK